MRKGNGFSGVNRVGSLKFVSLLVFIVLVLFLTACPLFNRPPQAVIEASPTRGEVPLEVGFNLSRSADPDGKIVWFELYFGDCTLPLTGTGDDLGRPIRHTYEGAGTFEAALTVRDDSGATDRATVTITSEGGASPIETLAVGSGSVKVGRTLEVPITLDQAPRGLAGYIMTAFLLTGAVADIEGVTLVAPRGAGAVDIAPDKRSVTFQAADFSQSVGPGDSDITLARIAFKGRKKGTSVLCVQIDRLDADGGDDLRPLTRMEPGRLTVTQ